MIIEDEATLATNSATNLTRYHYDAHTARSAAEGPAQCQIVQPDLALLALNLPDRYGLELLPLLKPRTAEVIVIVITGQESVRTAVYHSGRRL